MKKINRIFSDYEKLIPNKKARCKRNQEKNLKKELMKTLTGSLL